MEENLKEKNKIRVSGLLSLITVFVSSTETDVPKLIKQLHVLK